MTNPYNEALGATLIERAKRERIVLVGVTLPGRRDEETEASLDELAQLIATAGADEVGRVAQRRDAPDHTWFIGKGKAEELADLCRAVDADTVVFDNELSPAQQYNLEKLLGRKLFTRSDGRYQPTESARELYAFACARVAGPAESHQASASR